MAGSGSSASGQVRWRSRSMAVAPVEGVGSGPVGVPASSVRATVSNR